MCGSFLNVHDSTSTSPLQLENEPSSDGIKKSDLNSLIILHIQTNLLGSYGCIFRVETDKQKDYQPYAGNFQSLHDKA